MSIHTTNTRHSVIIRSHMEIPIMWNNFNLEDTIRFFRAKSKHIRATTNCHKDYLSIIDMLERAKGSNGAKLETLYQKKYYVYMVLSFETQAMAQHFRESIPEGAFFRSGLAFEVPMELCVNIPTSSLGIAQANFKMSTRRTNNKAFRKELNDAKDLLNLAYTEFNKVQIEALYQESCRLTFVLSFEMDSDVDRFLILTRL